MFIVIQRGKGGKGAPKEWKVGEPIPCFYCGRPSEWVSFSQTFEPKTQDSFVGGHCPTHHPAWPLPSFKRIHRPVVGDAACTGIEVCLLMLASVFTGSSPSLDDPIQDSGVV